MQRLLLVKQLIRKRPLASLALGSSAVTLSAAWVIEWHANYQEEHEQMRQQDAATTMQSPPIGSKLLPRTYDRESIRNYWTRRPMTIVKRVAEVAYEFAPLAFLHVRDFRLPSDRDDDDNNADLSLEARRIKQELLQHHAILLREALTNLGPAWVKGGQQLAIRPDLIPPTALKELQKLCDSVRPIPDEQALALIREELGMDDLSAVFEDLRLVASASLGQVYQARLKGTNETVAVKVQRPGMRRSFSMDLFLLQLWGDCVDSFTSTFTHQKPYHRDLFDAFSVGSYSELDYENEASNQIRFQRELRTRGLKVKIPNVYQQYTTEKVITTEWIEGKKLSDSSKEKIRELIPVGVELFLTQLLDIGAFHADPHPGNLIVTEEGGLCLLDFGLCAEVDPKCRDAMTKAIVHLLHRDFDSLVSRDAKELGFLPEDFDTTELKPILTKVLTVGLVESGSNLHKRKRKLQEISNELNDIFFRYPFSVPAFFALVTRGLGLLEGIALAGDPDFDIFMASAPYATKRAVKILGSHHRQQARGLSRLLTSRARRRNTLQT